MLKTVKFGGSSVADAEQFRKVKKIIETDDTRKLVVVSAAGKRNKDDHKLTDLLYLCHAHLVYGISGKEILAAVRERLVRIREDLGLAYDVGAEFDAYSAGLNKDTSEDELVSRGEYFTARLMADYLGYTFVDAVDCVFFGFDGHLDREKTSAAIRKAFQTNQKILIPGFYGSLPGGHIKVMKRGGSDITGALIAAATEADVYENWTDVSGILMADPRIVENPQPIARLTFGELRELAFAGASVLHEDAVLPVREGGIALNIRNTNCPENPGTLITETVEDDAASNDRFITGIAGRKSFHIITVARHNMNVNYCLRQALEIMERYHVPVEHITLGVDSFALVAATGVMGAALYDIVGGLQKACHTEDIRLQENVALVAAVGRKMTSRPGVSGKLFRALGENSINVRTIAQGADELSIIVGVDNSQYETAIRVLYDGFAG